MLVTWTERYTYFYFHHEMWMKRKNNEIDSSGFFCLFVFSLIKSIEFLYTITIVITCVTFSLGAITNYHEFRGLKQYKFIISEIFGPETWVNLVFCSWSHRLKARRGQGWVSSWWLRGGMEFELLQVAVRVQFLVAAGLRPHFLPACHVGPSLSS